MWSSLSQVLVVPSAFRTLQGAFARLSSHWLAGGKPAPERGLSSPQHRPNVSPPPPLHYARPPRTCNLQLATCNARLRLCCAALSAFFALNFGLIAIAADKTTYADHVLPLLEANCAKCHNPDKKKADLDLTSYPATLKGSGSGAVLLSGNPDGSKLWKALMHQEEPFMPPNRPKLPDKELEVFKQWILGGLLETATGKAVAAAGSTIDLALKTDAIGKPDGPPPMPKELPIEPVIHTPRCSAITGLASSPWAPLLAVAGQKQILLFNSQLSTLNSQLLGILPFPDGQPVDVKFSSNGKLLLACGGQAAKSGRVVLWDVTTGERLMTLGDDYDTVLAADIRADQSQVALGGPSRLVKLWSTQSGQLQHKLKKHTDWVTAVAFSPSGQLLATADRNGGISLWDPDNAQELFTLARHKAAVTALSWRADSKLLASASEDGTVKLWELQEGKEVKSWTAHPGGALCVHFAPISQLSTLNPQLLLVTCGRDNAMTLWDANGGKVRTLEAFGDLPLRAVFSHDGTNLFASDFAGHLAVWATADGKKVGELNPNPPPLAEQIAAAQKQIEALQGQGNSEPSQLAALNSQLSTLRAAPALSAAYHLRERLTAKKREQEKVVAALETQRQLLRKAEQELAAARQAAGKAEDQIKSAKAEVSRTEPTANQMAADLQAEQSRLEALLQQYRSALAGSNTPPKQ